MGKTIEQIREGGRSIRIPNLDEMYNDVVKFVQENQGEKGYIDCQPSHNYDTIYCFVYDDYSAQGEERMVYGVRVVDGDLEICFEQYMRTYQVIYDDATFKGENEEGGAEWFSVKWSDIYYIPTIFSIAESIWEYV